MPRDLLAPTANTKGRDLFAPDAANPATPKIGVAEDALKAGASGLATGAIGFAGMPGDVSNMLGAGAGTISGWRGASPETKNSIAETVRRGMPLWGNMPTTGEIQSKITDATGWAPYEPQTTPGEYARTTGEFAPGMLFGGPKNLLARALTNVVLPAFGSETGGQLTKGTAVEPYARIAGAILGSVAPSVIGRAITPFPSKQPRQQMVKTLRNEGVDLTAGQATGRRGLQYFESEMGGAAAARFTERQGEQFTRAALQRAGINAARATPEVMDDAFTRIGQQFDDLAARNNLAPVNTQLADDLVGPNGVLTTYRDVGGVAPVVEDTVLDIGKRLSSNQVLSGDYYKSITSKLARLARGTGDPDLQQALHGIRNALDDAMEQSLARHNPADLGAWREVRNQYRNILVIERAATAAGPTARAGIISPAALRSATVNVQGRRNFARGLGDFDELARAGEGVMDPLPQSGTAPRIRAQNLGTGLSTLLGAGIGGTAGGGIGAAAGALAGGLIPGLAGRAALSPIGRALLSNQAMSPALQRLAPGQSSLAAALVGSRQFRLPPE